MGSSIGKDRGHDSLHHSILFSIFVAYHLSLAKYLKVAVIEKDPRYVHASAMLSVHIPLSAVAIDLNAIA
jgi:hypothetical protein